MERSKIEVKLKGIIADQLGIGEDEVKSDSSFIEDLGCDSLDIVELVMAVEEEFDVEIPDEKAEELTTFKSAVDFIENGAK